MIKAIQNTTQFILQVPISNSTDDLMLNYFSMRNYKWAEIDVICGAGTHGNLQLHQAKTVLGGSTKELIINTGDFVQNDPTALDGGPGDDLGAGALWTVSTVTNSGIADSLVNIAANTAYKAEIRNDALDVDNDFDCLAIELEDTNTSGLVCVKVTLHGGRFQGDPNNRKTIPSPLVNQEASV